MGLASLDIALRGAAIALFLLLALLFARDWNRSLTTRLGAFLTLAAACYVSLIVIDAVFGFPWWRLPLHVMSLAAPPLFWLFVSSWFDDEFELRLWHWGVVAAVVACGLMGNYLFTFSQRPNFPGLIWRLMSIASVVLGLWASLKGRAGDLIEPRRRVRFALAVVIAFFILWIVLGEIGLRRWPPPESWRAINAFGMVVLAMTVALSILGWRDPALVAAPVRPALPVASRIDADDSVLLAKLDADMRTERLYRQNGLTISVVAARMRVPEYRLRRAINQGLGARNFNAYLNSFRLSEACEALADPEQLEVPILTIALDAGFGSLAPFNRAFRNSEGCTPTEFRALALIKMSNSIG
jgi:AraC-like DNA-binding protein